MKLTTILILGATVLATPALAQGAPQAPGVAGASRITPGETASANTGMTADTSSNSSASASSGASGASSSQMAMNSGASDSSAVSSVPNTEKKYKASTRSSDNMKEAETTKQLNMQIASAK